MSQNTTEQIVDVRPLTPREKHPAIFNTWKSLDAGGSLQLVNDHDPAPVYFQFSCEHTGEFFWEYLERGPEVWRVRIRKGDFPDPGFVPPKRTPKGSTSSAKGIKPLVLDTRPIFQRGETPCGAIDEAVASLEENQPFVLLVPFEPAPLYAKLGSEGFSHNSQQMEDGSWRVEFQRQA